ncbi:TRAP transporter substrate-binding protein, partial [Octadecabacter sp.]|nr:TRAP transporter substrate-binding protein [Octadecabacter sp.]
MTKSFTLRGALLGSCLAFAASSVAAEELRGWNIHVEDYPVSIAMESFAAEVAERTGGEVTAK